MKNWLKWLSMTVLVVAVYGCTSPKEAYQAGVNSALHQVGSDLVGGDVMKEAIKHDTSTIPEQFSQIQDSGLVHWMRQRNWARNPDGSVAKVKVKDQEIPLTEDYESMTKWASLQTLGGGFKKLALKIGDLFMPDAGNPAAPANTVRDSRNGFGLVIDDATGGIGRDAGTVAAHYEGQAKVMERVEAALGTTLDKHWAGVTGYIKVRNDGNVAIVGAVGGVVKEVVGKLINLTAYGAGSNVIQALVKEVDSSGTVAETPTTVVVTPTQTAATP